MSSLLYGYWYTPCSHRFKSFLNVIIRLTQIVSKQKRRSASSLYFLRLFLSYKTLLHKPPQTDYLRLRMMVILAGDSSNMPHSVYTQTEREKERNKSHSQLMSLCTKIYTVLLWRIDAALFIRPSYELNKKTERHCLK